MSTWALVDLNQWRNDTSWREIKSSTTTGKVGEADYGKQVLNVGEAGKRGKEKDTPPVAQGSSQEGVPRDPQEGSRSDIAQSFCF